MQGDIDGGGGVGGGGALGPSTLGIVLNFWQE